MPFYPSNYRIMVGNTAFFIHMETVWFKGRIAQYNMEDYAILLLNSYAVHTSLVFHFISKGLT